MKIVWFEQDCIHTDPEIDATFENITENTIKEFCDDEHRSYDAFLEYSDEKVKIFQALEQIEGESLKFICVK